MKYKLWIIFCIAGLCITASAQIGSSEFDLQAFLEQIEINNYRLLHEQGIVPNSQQWAMILGYALKRQADTLEDLETDKARMNRLMEEVKEFLVNATSDDTLWTIALEAYIGRYDKEVLQLMGGYFTYSPVFTSIEEQIREETGPPGDFESHPDRDLIISLAERMFTLLRSGEYTSISSMLGGRMVKEFKDWRSQIESDATEKAEADKFRSNMEWKFISGEVLDTEPPRVRLKYNIKSDFFEWQQHELVFLRDAGIWKIVKFNEVN